MSILSDFARQGYLHQITDAANDIILVMWDNDDDAPTVSHGQVAAVIDAIEAAQQSVQRTVDNLPPWYECICGNGSATQRCPVHSRR